MLSMCDFLGIPCIEPGFAPHYTSTGRGNQYDFSDLFNTSLLPLVPRDTFPRPLRPDAYVYLRRKGSNCWLGGAYLHAHGLAHHPSPDVNGSAGYARLIGVNYGAGRTGFLHASKLIQSYILDVRALRRSSSCRQIVIALVYCGGFLGEGRFGQPKEASKAFWTFRRNTLPTFALLRQGAAVLDTLFSGERYVAVHMRIRDGCTVSLESWSRFRASW